MKTSLLLVATIIICTSCTDWFDVDQPTVVRQEDQFSTEKGFYHALFGTYLLAADQKLYGRELSYELIDVMANMYIVKDNNTVNIDAQNHVYTNQLFENRSNAIWSNGYNLIANSNNILLQMKGKEELFPGGHFEIMKAELLAMRAFMHFDLLRLYAPAPAAGSGLLALPYADSISHLPFKQLSVNAFLERVMSDLEESFSLMLEYDYIFYNTQSFLESFGNNGFLEGWGNRFNTAAVAGLISRVALYKGDKAKAYEYAKLITNTFELNQSEVTFFWTKDLLGSFLNSKTSEISKRCFSQNEGSYTLIISDFMQTDLFKDASISAKSSNSSDSSLITDKRYQSLFSSRTNETGIFLNKYFVGSTCHSLFKISEAYLIAAETATENGDTAVYYLNHLRKSRGLAELPANIAEEDLQEEIYNEYRKEFLGEGQLFYYHKRKNAASYKGINLRTIYGLTYKSYVLPIPVSEIEFGNIEIN
jgi:starch-binding outer membrane protein, SusD/RagB family